MTLKSISRPVSSVEWNSEPGFADKVSSKSASNLLSLEIDYLQIARRRVPTVVSNSPFLGWPAANWTPSYLATNVPFVLTKKSRYCKRGLFFHNCYCPSVQCVSPSKSIFRHFSKNKARHTNPLECVHLKLTEVWSCSLLLLLLKWTKTTVK